MLFDFQAYIADLREKAEKKQVVEKYEKAYGPITGGMKDQVWYKEYVINFKPMKVEVPEELKDDFDWDILIKFVASSFSSECVLEKNLEKEILELVISVKSGDQTVVKRLGELRSFQVLRLYEIYIEEQMNLQALVHDDEKEKAAIVAQRQARIQKRKLMIDNLDKEELIKAAEEEKESKLEDLMGQL
jgi:hypothetical protein